MNLLIAITRQTKVQFMKNTDKTQQSIHSGFCDQVLKTANGEMPDKVSLKVNILIRM